MLLPIGFASQHFLVCLALSKVHSLALFTKSGPSLIAFDQVWVWVDTTILLMRLMSLCSIEHKVNEFQCYLFLELRTEMVSS